MENKKFEILLESDRNWVSRYGGFVSLFLIIMLFEALIGIEIPLYDNIVRDNQGAYTIT
ncbi:hypothetical protein [Subsaximicrobium wynnwilliamsii]|uniref:hypothetical protein n=1 Tax=Subsaximicrobium wynnwilliamsii TaxID=291179 RepID=UPI001672F51A|nr:hypothetical protein [Subsaximicrobium wynnwilliamsii]